MRERPKQAAAPTATWLRFRAVDARGRRRRSAARTCSSLPAPAYLHDSYASTALAETLDRSLDAALSRYTAGLSPMAQMAAFWDWASHLAFSPGKRAMLAEKGAKKWLRLANYAMRSALQVDGNAPCIEPLPQDRRFEHPAWRTPPFDLAWQAFLLQQQWWHNATTDVRGVTRQHERMVAFAARQFLDLLSPSNFAFTNPEILQRTLQEGGRNLLRGAGNLRRGLGPHAGRQAAGGRRRLRGRARCRRDSGQGGVPQPADRTDPVRADHCAGAARAGAVHPGVDQQVLHPRPLARELAGPLAGRTGLHGIHDLLAQSWSGRSRHDAG